MPEVNKVVSRKIIARLPTCTCTCNYFILLSMSIYMQAFNRHTLCYTFLYHNNHIHMLYMYVLLTPWHMLCHLRLSNDRLISHIFIYVMSHSWSSLHSSVHFTSSIFYFSFISHFQEIIVISENNKSERLLCPLCNGVFRDPFIATCGVSLSHYFLSLYVYMYIYLSIYLSLSLPASPLSLLPLSPPSLPSSLLSLSPPCVHVHVNIYSIRFVLHA